MLESEIWILSSNYFQNLNYLALVGHRSIVNKSSAYGAKGPGFKPQRRQEFIIKNGIVCSVHWRK